ncbi:sodium:solute symporter family protein [Halomonas sp. MCCC 1A17488]|uniref:Sodium:solute symporter family protein n=1 Tax=Billgrantia sulfidoxydans TaxID=2733484 RepID=A0ABX7WBR8_9GAMM|nr:MULTISPECIES: sodium:solute symporter family protein [Halomonas]MCE8018443.1 sodium:solute symporter family protein [Halomonas sp. MCCC 1A17488]MCG3241776.1 sodium:solute symporter family protein [Halomonas sp. MCCC 1A17488]QPP49197.1 sodium:solute symporter family protein [Halomonas sp. SS10-MC5]QTP56533.1 sodium:solute symporter family protein [Halomonas sulfidoxydans]
MTDSLIVVGITLAYLAMVLWVGLRARGQSDSSLEGYVAGGRHVGVVILFFILGAEIFSAFAFLGAPGWAYQHGSPAFYILAYLALIPITIWALGPRVAELGREKGYLTQGDMIADHYRSKSLGMLAGGIGVLALVPYLTIQIAGAGLLFQAATGGLIPFWLGALLAFVVVAAYVFCSGLSGIGWTNLVQGIMMIAIAWFLGLAIPERLYGGVGEMFAQLQQAAPEYLTMPGATGMHWGYFSTAVLVSAFGGAMWPHLFMKFYSADSGRTLRKVSVFYPLYAYLLVPLLFIGFAGILVFADEPLTRADTVLLRMVIDVADFSPWVIGLMLSGALAAAMSTGANLAHTAAIVLVRDVLGPTVMKHASEHTTVSVTRWSVLGLSLVAYLFALANPASLVLLLLGAYGLIVQLFPMVIGALFLPSLRRASVMAGALAGSVAYLLMEFAWSSPLGWHAGVWAMLLNVGVVAAWQGLGHASRNGHPVSSTPSH